MTKLGEVRCHYEEKLSQGESVVIAVRPESVSLHKEKNMEKNINTIPGRVKERSYLGNLYDYKILCADSSLIRIQEDPWKVFEIGENVYFSFSFDKAWIIRAKSSMSLNA